MTKKMIQDRIDETANKVREHLNEERVNEKNACDAEGRIYHSGIICGLKTALSELEKLIDMAD